MIRIALGVLLFLHLAGGSAGASVDSGASATTIAGWDAGLLAEWGAAQPWLRLRAIPRPPDTEAVAKELAALHVLRGYGFKTVPLLRLPVKDWKKKYLPEDLRETYEQARELGRAYGNAVDAWEVDNEPDLGFVPESAERYTAFLKATYLGLKAGGRERGAGSKEFGASPNNQQRTTNNPIPSAFSLQPSDFPPPPLVLMGSLGLPPGPWLERFAANDGFAYTDGYNYHYYGYADDFTGVYHQHEAAVAELGVGGYALGGNNASNSERLTSNSRQKSFPIFLTEIGYGMLGKEARGTKQGRLRQWRWFKTVGEQVDALRIEGPMAFYLPPYLEYDTSEYGLTAPWAPLKPETGNRKPEGWTAGGIGYAAGDFAEPTDTQLSAFSSQPSPEPWMEIIGKAIDGNELTPAGAWWLAGRRTEGGRQMTEAGRSWSIATPAPSPIVIDFLPGEGLSHIKRYNGYFVTASEVERVAPNALDRPPAKKPEPKPKPSAPVRSEEFIIQVRTANGNLYEVYPTRQATSDWQHFMEPGDNFTMAFYGRAALPWRFKDNQPASLVFVMYPKQLPVTYVFRRAQLLELGSQAGHVVSNAPLSPRYGAGRVVLYNFSDKPVTGRLSLPDCVTLSSPKPTENNTSVQSMSSVVKGGMIELSPRERREIPVIITVPAGSYERVPAEFVFTPASHSRLREEPHSRHSEPREEPKGLSDPLPAPHPQPSGFRSQVSGLKPDSPSSPSNPEPLTSNHAPSVPSNPEHLTSNTETTARFRTSFLPDIAGIKSTLVAQLLPPPARHSEPREEPKPTRPPPSALGPQPSSAFPATRPRASEEAPMTEQSDTGIFAPPGTHVESTADGFSVTVTSVPPGKAPRIEVEIPWPDGVEFKSDMFLSAEFRLR